MRLHRVAAARRVATTLVLALFLLGCAPAGEPVQLLTGVVPGYTDNGGCFLDAAEGLLSIDPTYGTMIRDKLARSQDGGNPVYPVMWPPGYTGRRVGSKVVVLDGWGNVVATTGRKYRIEGAQDHNEMGQWGWVACGFVVEK